MITAIHNFKLRCDPGLLCVKPFFVPQVIDRMIRVPDAATYATIHFLEKLLNRKPGGSTGTNVYAAFQLMAELNAQGHEGSVVSMLCDPGDRYLDTYYNTGWLAEKGFDLKPYTQQMETFYDTGLFTQSGCPANKKGD